MREPNLSRRSRRLPFIIFVIAFFVISFYYVVPSKKSLSGRGVFYPLSFGSISTGSRGDRKVFPVSCAAPLPSIQRRTGSAKWVISYGLYGGENARYVGAIKQTIAVHAKTLFPEWTVRIYYDESISEATRRFLRDHGAELIPGPLSVPNKMCWRFLSAVDPEVERFISRDADSFLTLREKWAVDEWVKSGKKFHNMRDHPSGGQYTMMGGMWGAQRGAIPDFERVLKGEGRQNYMVDMDIINRHVWPLLRKDALQHDAFTCNLAKFSSNKPFPYPRVGWEIVGGVVINPETGETRPGDIKLIANAKPPQACVPPIKPLRVVSQLLGHPRVEVQCNWTFAAPTTRFKQCPDAYASFCDSAPRPCDVHLVRVKDVFADWDWGSGYGALFDAETAFLPHAPLAPPLSLFERNSTGLMERVRYLPRLAHVLLPQCDSTWAFGALVLPRLRRLLEKLEPSIPILLARSEIAERMLAHLNQAGEFNISRVIWHAGNGHLYYAQEMWFVLSACNVVPNDSPAPHQDKSRVVSCGNLASLANMEADDVLENDTPIEVVLRKLSQATTFVCSTEYPWISFLDFLRDGARVVEIGESGKSELLELAQRKQLDYSFRKT